MPVAAKAGIVQRLEQENTFRIHTSFPVTMCMYTTNVAAPYFRDSYFSHF